MLKSTPGPWKISGFRYEEYWIVDSKSPEHGRQNVIAQLLPHWKSNAGEAARANARLIAAAPMMLDALEYVLSKAKQEPVTSFDIGIVVAAIRAAKGE